MEDLRILMMIERDFTKAFKALSTNEAMNNRNLWGKTRRVATLLATVARLRRAGGHELAANDQQLAREE